MEFVCQNFYEFSKIYSLIRREIESKFFAIVRIFTANEFHIKIHFGNGLFSIMFALVVQNWIGTAKMIRAQFYRYRDREYVLASRTLGVKDMTLIFRHILPNAIGPIITRAMVAIPSAIFTESFLAYIGLGIRAPECSIGVLLAQGQTVMMQYPVQVFFPATVISILMISFNMLSNGLRDAFDPTQRGA